MPIAKKKILAVAGTTGALLLLSPGAQAQSIIKNPGDHPHYSVELEPHLLLGWSEHYAGDGFGLGGRVSIPLTHRGFVSTINNSVAIGVGLDWVHYGDCNYYYGGDGYGCGADFFEFPIVMQWNFYLTRHWSLFVEPGLYVYHGAFNENYCGNGKGGPVCGYPSATSVDVAFWGGARYQFTDKVALTMRVGYPTLSIGISIMP